jgi:quercetin dioxygenase-like cupin family protein
MTTVDLKTLELLEFTAKGNSQQHCRATFPLIGAHGSKNLATVYFELEPGDTLGRHTDSAEELIVVLEGELEAHVGGETGRVGAGSITLVPEMMPHNFVNIGNSTAKVLGVFGGKNNIISTFDTEWLPTESSVVDTTLLG